MSTNVIRQAPCPDCAKRTDPFLWCERCFGSGYVPLIAKPQPSGKALLRAALIFGLTFLAGVLLVLRQLRLL